MSDGASASAKKTAAAAAKDDATAKTPPADRLDFYSDSFDPLLALKCASARPPVPGAKTFDNLAMFDAHLRRARAEGAAAARPRPGGSREQQVEQAFARRFLPHQMPVKSTKVRRTLQNVFTRMAQCEGQEGVFGVLERARSQALEVTIRIRHSHGVRGVLFATVTAYDKFWNMALTNVTEYWIRRRKSKTPAIGPASRSAHWAKHFPRSEVVGGAKMAAAAEARDEVRALAKMLAAGEHGRDDKNSELCRRRVNELLVRGEQVVFIGVAQGRRS